MSTEQPETSTLTRDAVEEWLGSIRRQLDEVGARISPLLAEQHALKQRESLLASLLKSFDSSGVDAAVAVATDSVPAAPPVESVRDYVCAGVRAVLEEANGPLHINEIHSRFIGRGLRVPGAGKPANLTAHLVSCDGISSPRRGFYALGAEQQGRESARAAKRRRRRRRRARP